MDENYSEWFWVNLDLQFEALRRRLHRDIDVRFASIRIPSVDDVMDELERAHPDPQIQALLALGFPDLAEGMIQNRRIMRNLGSLTDAWAQLSNSLANTNAAFAHWGTVMGPAFGESDPLAGLLGPAHTPAP